MCRGIAGVRPTHSLRGTALKFCGALRALVVNAVFKNINGFRLKLHFVQRIVE